MYIVQVQVHVKPEFTQAFLEATIENARKSLEEPGVARFDVLQQLEAPTRFLLVEVYRTPDDPARHKETAHYRVWRSSVAGMMEEPRQSTHYINVFPGEAGWG